MDDFDGERFALGGQALATGSSRLGRRAGRRSARPRGEAAASRGLRRDGDREELRCAEPGRPAVIRVRALSGVGRDQLRSEVQLLAALEVSGIGAAPAVLEVEDEGYVREDAALLQGRPGRRCAEDATPHTSERRAQARAREGLDALIDALHDRGWVLGAPHGEGAGVRADGSVTVLDLSGLRPQEATGARLEDRRWVDSVLRDEGRTLRRRIDMRGAPAQSALSAPAPPITAAGSMPHTGGPARPGMPVEPGEAVPPGESVTLAEPGEDLDELIVDAEVAPSLRPLPAPRANHRSAPSWRLRPGRVRFGLRGAGIWRRVQEVFDTPRPRRIALLSAAAVLIAGGALGSGAWWLVPESSAPAPPASTAPSDRSPADGTTGAGERAGGPRITDPLSLATDLAHARYDYLTGAGTGAVAAPGSPAEEADEQVRRAYQGAVVEGGRPEVLAARVVAGPTQEGTARLEVEMLTPAHTVTEPDGSRTSMAATAAATVQLELAWSDGHWRVNEIRPG